MIKYSTQVALEIGGVSSLRLTLAASGVVSKVNLPSDTMAVIIRTALTDVIVARGEDPAALGTGSGTTVTNSAFSVGELLPANVDNFIQLPFGADAMDIRLRSQAGGTVDIIAVTIHKETNISL